MNQRRQIAALLVAAAVTIAIAVWVVGSWGGEQGRAAAGFDYRGTFYRLSSAEVRNASLGAVLDEDVPFQDGAVTVRRIRGVDPTVALAAYTSTFPGTGSVRSHGWLLLSPQAPLAADPWADAGLRLVVRPPPPR